MVIADSTEGICVELLSEQVVDGLLDTDVLTKYITTLLPKIGFNSLSSVWVIQGFFMRSQTKNL